MKTSLNGLLFVTLTGLTTSVFAADQVNNDYWRVSSNVYMELENLKDTIIPAVVGLRQNHDGWPTIFSES